MPRLCNKTARITGGTSGIGLATARRFVEEGARVAITGVDPGRVEAARQGLGADVIGLPAEAGDVAGQREIARAVGAAFGRLDIVFVNAGIGDFRPVEQWDEAGFDRSMAVNLKGPFFLVQALLPILADPASIVLNASINARTGQRADRDAEFQRVFGDEGRAGFAGAHAVGRADRARHPRQRRQPRPGGDAAA